MQIDTSDDAIAGRRLARCVTIRVGMHRDDDNRPVPFEPVDWQRLGACIVQAAEQAARRALELGVTDPPETADRGRD